MGLIAVHEGLWATFNNTCACIGDAPFPEMAPPSQRYSVTEVSREYANVDVTKTLTSRNKNVFFLFLADFLFSVSIS